MSMYLKTSVRVLAVFVAILFLFSAVPLMKVAPPPVQEAAAAIGEDYVHVGYLNMDIAFWNPFTIQMVEDYVACYLMYAGLWTYDEDWGGPINDLAIDWDQTVNADNTMTTWVKITDKAYFRNIKNLEDTSKKLTAYDVKYTIELVRNYTGLTWDWYTRDITEIQVLNNYELNIITSYPKATLINDLCQLPIVYAKYWSTLKNPMAKNMAAADQMGCGAFVYEDSVSKSWWAFKKAPNFYGETVWGWTVDIPGIMYRFYSDSTAIAAAINDGEVDAVNLLGDVTTYLKVLGNNTDLPITKFAVSEPGICDVAINAIPEYFDTPTYYGGNPVLRDPAVRKAIMMTLNKTWINDVLLQGLSVRAASVVHPSEWQADITELPFDPAAARNILIAAGYSADSDGDGYLEATASALAVKEGWCSVGYELNGIRCEAPDTDPNYYMIAQAWVGDAKKAGIGLAAAKKSEGVMTNQAWYASDYDIWVWHWGWGPEPIGAALTCWLTEEIRTGGYNCQGPMGPWWVHGSLNGYTENYSTSPFVNASMIEEFNMDSDTFIGFSALDQNISTALKTIDKAERMVITDKLQQWIYDSYTENPPYYDVGLYGVSDARFTGWGDWSAHPGRPITSDLPWIWFDLEPASNVPPTFTSGLSDSYQAVKGQEFTVSIQVKDADGDPIKLNCSWGDGSDIEYAELDENTDVAQTVTFSHFYETIDNVELEITAWDYQPRHEVKTSALVDVVAEADMSPVFSLGSPSGTPASPVYVDQDVEWTATVSDAETDETGVIKITWEWGDGTYDVEELSPTELGGTVKSEQTHAWSEPATYLVKVWAWDGYEDDEDDPLHNVSAQKTYIVLENTAPYRLAVPDIMWTASSWAPVVGMAIDEDPDELTFTWEWDDGTFNVTSKTNANPGSTVYDLVWHMWDSDGDYEVTLWVDDGHGHNESLTVTATIGDEAGPTALSLMYEPDPAMIDIEVTFTATAYDANGDGLTFTLEFGDDDLGVETTSGGSADAQTATFTHTYSEAGDYMAVLSVDDGTVNTTQEFFVRVIENKPPHIALQSSFVALYNKTFRITPTDVSDADGDDVTVWYDWGDSTPMTMADPENDYSATHIYKAIGAVTLTAHADDGKANVSVTTSVTVTEANLWPTVVSITKSPATENHKVGDVITFSVTIKDTEGDNVTVKIVYGDGGSNQTVVDTESGGVEVTVTFTHTFETAGTYTVVASANDGQDHSNPTAPSKPLTVEVKKASAGTNWLLIGAVIGLLAVVAIAAALMMMKRKKKEEGESGAGGMEGMAPPESP